MCLKLNKTFVPALAFAFITAHYVSLISLITLANFSLALMFLIGGIGFIGSMLAFALPRSLMGRQIAAIIYLVALGGVVLLIAHLQGTVFYGLIISLYVLGIVLSPIIGLFVRLNDK